MTDPTPTDPPDELGDTGLKALEAERKARRSAEQALRAADERVQAMQRREVERVAGRAADGFRPLLAPQDLWTTDVDLADLIDDTGAVDASKVREQVGKVLEQRPHWGSQPPRVAGSADGGRGAATEPSMDELAAKLIRGH